MTRPKKKGLTLRFELDIDERQLPELATLPGEFMRVKPTLGYRTLWIGTNPSLVFSRHRPPPIPPQPIQLARDERLRIALAVAAPNDLRKVKYELIWEELQNWAREQRDRIGLLGIVNPANRQKIDEILERRPHILHFIGHGRVKDELQRDVRQIALVDAFNGAEWLDADKFVDLFNRHQPGVVVLQTCEGAMSSGTDAFVGVASFIVQQNIPVVVAMQYEISNATAQPFALEFYKRLAVNEPVDKAAQEGRRRIALGPNSYASRDFATPVLFMRVKDGRLFLSLPTTFKETDNQIEKEKSGDAKSVLIQQLKGYLQQLQDLLYIIQSGDTDKIDFNQEAVDLFLRDLTEISRGVNSLRPTQNLLQALPWVASLSGSIEGARNELRVIGVLLTKSQNEKNVRSRLKSYENCQQCLTKAISQLSELTDPLTKRPYRGIWH